MGQPFPAKIVVAAVQAASVFLDEEKTVGKACSLIREAGAKGAKVIAFPEGFIPGRPFWYHFYPSMAAITHKYYVELFKNAVEVPSLSTDKLCRAAAEAGAFVVLGISERVRGTTGTLYNSQLFIGSDGQIMGCHRKIVPTLAERFVYGSGDGSSISLVPTPFGPLGGLLCGENTNSLIRFYLLAQGEKIHVAGWPPWFAEHEQYFKQGLDFRTRNHAFEGKIYVINSCGIVAKETLESICPTDKIAEHMKIVSDGGHSSIIGPRGEFLAGPLESGEGIIYAEIDYERMVSAKIVHDVIGHYNRFDIFQLMVNRRKLTPLKLKDEIPVGRPDWGAVLAEEESECREDRIAE